VFGWISALSWDDISTRQTGLFKMCLDFPQISLPHTSGCSCTCSCHWCGPPGCIVTARPSPEANQMA
jgi:hypothetical protein